VIQQRVFQPDHDTSLAIRTMDAIHVQHFAALTEEFIDVLDQLQSIRLPAYRLTLVDELQRICEEARQLHTAQDERADDADTLTFA